MENCLFIVDCRKKNVLEKNIEEWQNKSNNKLKESPIHRRQ